MLDLLPLRPVHNRNLYAQTRNGVNFGYTNAKILEEVFISQQAASKCQICIENGKGTATIFRSAIKEEIKDADVKIYSNPKDIKQVIHRAFDHA